jgi:carbonyl reductase 1
VAELNADSAVVAAGGRVRYAPLDLSDADSPKQLADTLRRDYKNQPIAILVNNAGFAYKGDAWGADETLTTLSINFRGTRAVTRALLPLMVESCAGAADKNLLPRVVLVTSSAGGLGMFDRAQGAGGGEASAELKRRFLAAGGMGEDEAAADAALDTLASEFERAVADDTWRKEGWPSSMYGVSKAAANAYGRQLAARGWRQAGAGAGGDGGAGGVGASSSSSLLPRWASINVHPGYISTNMSSYKGPLPPSRGADTPVWCALLPAEEASAASGAFYHDRQLREY